jgi:hypothetical protein
MERVRKLTIKQCIPYAEKSYKLKPNTVQIDAIKTAIRRGKLIAEKDLTFGQYVIKPCDLKEWLKNRKKI